MPQPESKDFNFTIVRPFLTRYAIARTGSPDIPGRYSSEQEVWVMDVDGREVPIIEAGANVSELTTKTKVNNEQDDEAASLGFGTHTAVKAEGDDLDSAIISLALATLTEVRLEKDD